jgi:hypothetical protein
MVCDGGLGRGFESLHRAPKVLKLGTQLSKIRSHRPISFAILTRSRTFGLPLHFSLARAFTGLRCEAGAEVKGIRGHIQA